MILFHEWEIAQSDGILAQQYDHLSRNLTVQGELPEGYSWVMLVQVGDALDLIPLSPTQGGIGAVLTEDQLSASGWYSLQLRGTMGASIRHTNVIQSYVPASLSGAGQWPTVPSEFIQLEAKLEALSTHPPVPGELGYWLIWDTESETYTQSQFPLPSGGESEEGGSDELWYPTLSQEGVLFWQRSSSALTPSSQNIKGPQGSSGPAGQNGASAYEQAEEAGYSGTLEEFTAALSGVGNKQDVLISSGAAVGQIAKITAVDASGKPTTWGTADMPGLKLAGVAQSPGADGKYNVPFGTNTSAGLVKGDANAAYGVSVWSDGTIEIISANEVDISARDGDWRPIVPTNLDFAVKAALCDGVGEAWTTAEKQAAMTRMGVNAAIAAAIGDAIGGSY